MKTFALSKVGLHPGGRVTSVLWGQVDTGTTTVDISVTESTKLAMGWSVKKTLMGKVIYNDAGTRVGKVEDLIISPDKTLSYVIVGAVVLSASDATTWRFPSPRSRTRPASRRVTLAKTEVP
jgi:hypothetical protein